MNTEVRTELNTVLRTELNTVLRTELNTVLRTELKTEAKTEQPPLSLVNDIYGKPAESVLAQPCLSVYEVKNLLMVLISVYS